MTYWTTWWYILYIYIDHVASQCRNIIQMKLLKKFDVCCWVIHDHSIAVLKHMLWGLNVLFSLASVVPQLPIQNPFLSNKWVKEKSKPRYICSSISIHFPLFPSISFHVLLLPFPIHVLLLPFPVHFLLLPSISHAFPSSLTNLQV